MAMTEEEKQVMAKLTADNEQFKTDLGKKDGEIADLKAKVDELTPQAELGKQYREDVVTAALASGVRDKGNDFEEESYKKMFAALTVEEIKAMGEKWEASALEKLGVPESKTNSANMGLPGEDEKPAIDPSLYTVGR
jgi:predicted nuclease with TOPRIM domain